VITRAIAEFFELVEQIQGVLVCQVRNIVPLAVAIFAMAIAAKIDALLASLIGFLPQFVIGHDGFNLLSGILGRLCKRRRRNRQAQRKNDTVQPEISPHKFPATVKAKRLNRQP
jgi:hypothetical protein